MYNGSIPVRLGGERTAQKILSLLQFKPCPSLSSWTMSDIVRDHFDILPARS